MYQYICKECGEKFENSNKNRVYCSNECKNIALKKRLSLRQKDLKNKEFGRLTALYSRNINKRYEWLCKCKCGKKVWVKTANLVNGHTKSCGCLNREVASQNNSKYFKKYRQKNYVEDTSISKIKAKINKNNISGVRGVYYDKSTKKWIGKLTYKRKTYSKAFKKKSDAIKYRKHLEKKYFKPILDKYETKNKRGEKIKYNGETHTLHEWSEILGIDDETLRIRYKKHSSDLDYVFSKKLHSNKNKQIELTYNNETHSLSKWSEILGINFSTLLARYKKHSENLDYVLSTKNGLNKIDVEYNGEKHSLSEWSKILNIDYSVVYWRYRKSPNDLNYVFSKKSHIKSGKSHNDSIIIEYNNETHSLSKWSEILGIKYNTLYQRYNRNPSNLEYIFKPINNK